MGKYKFWPEDIVGEAMWTSLIWSGRIDKPGDLVSLLLRKNKEFRAAVSKLKTKHLWPPSDQILGSDKSLLSKLKEKFAEEVKKKGNVV